MRPYFAYVLICLSVCWWVSQDISLLLPIFVVDLWCAVVAARSVSPSCMQLRCLY
jgi:hypothetical protein